MVIYKYKIILKFMKKIAFLFVIISSVFFVNVCGTFAVDCNSSCAGLAGQSYDACWTACNNNSTGVTAAPTTINAGSCNGSACTLANPLAGKVDNVQQLIGKVISAVLGVVGSIALIMFIYGGLTWMLAAGNAQNVEKGKSILMWATIGLVIIFSSYAMVQFVFTGLGVGAK